MASNAPMVRAPVDTVSMTTISTSTTFSSLPSATSSPTQASNSKQPRLTPLIVVSILLPVLPLLVFICFLCRWRQRRRVHRVQPLPLPDDDSATVQSDSDDMILRKRELIAALLFKDTQAASPVLPVFSPSTAHFASAEEEKARMGRAEERLSKSTSGDATSTERLPSYNTRSDHDSWSRALLSVLER
ncbi:hypothetical protein EXIGLDRAFT_720379 [Exidia glandulosa HHB12029]|uniref:Uncharacterized protein n=1 Tax=Exidia glandulosa HHB12029 TaxID=1314781 RepID=A0A165GDX1_EXIGL|nr:hypothetical protein EXIGLDRAFT_720379 [Exidia glandulosa HHB12029]